MKILFINPYITNVANYPNYPPIGLLSMAASLKKKGHNVVLLDANFENLADNEVVKRIEQIKPSLVGITINVLQAKHAFSYIDKIAEKFKDLPLIIGGPYITGLEKNIFTENKNFKFAICGEGEYAIIEFIEYLNGKRKIEDVSNLMYVSNSKVQKNLASRIEDLNALPLPDYSLIEHHISEYNAPHPSIAQPSMHIMCTRGCPFKCQFCSSPKTWGSKVTFRNVDSIVEEVELLANKYGVKEIFFQDDTLNLRKEWFIKLCDALISKGLHKKVYFKCPFRANRKHIDEHILKKAKEANFWLIFYGVESGNQEMLDKMHKHITLDEIKNTFDLTHEIGIKTFASFMIGNIGENETTVKDSIRFYKELDPDYGGFAYAMPFPGSEMYNLAKSNDHINIDNYIEYEFNTCVMRTEQLSSERIFELTRLANEQINKTNFTTQSKMKKEPPVGLINETKKINNILRRIIGVVKKVIFRLND